MRNRALRVFSAVFAMLAAARSPNPVYRQCTDPPIAVFVSPGVVIMIASPKKED
jgi:hypothetical protein